MAHMLDIGTQNSYQLVNENTRFSPSILIFFCFIGRCDVGQQWDIKINTCEPCPKGSYSDTDSYLPCAQCSGSKETTLQSGAGSKSACYEPDTLDAEFADGKRYF